MTKVMYNGELIELSDELEPGYKEFDFKDNMSEETKDLEKTMEIKINDLEDTGIINLGDEND